jgi:hypothetical protein
MVCVPLCDVELAGAVLTSAVCYHRYAYPGNTLTMHTRYPGLLVRNRSCSFVHHVFYDSHG